MLIREVTRPLSFSKPVEKICEDLKKKDSQICELRYGECIILRNMQWKITCLISRPILMPLYEKLVGLPSLVPRLPWNAKYTRVESLVSHDHDIIKIGPEFLATFSTNFAFNARCV